MDLYVWVGEDETGDFGIKMIVTPFGDATPASFAKRRVAENGIILNQIQLLANKLNRPMTLKRFESADDLRVLTPQPQG